MKYNKSFNNTYTTKSSKEDEDDICFAPKTLRMFHKSFEVNLVDVYLDEPIIATPYYRELIHYMNNMEEHDRLNIYIDTVGGDLNSTLALTSAMHTSEGEITVFVTGQASSAGSIIALSAPSLVLGENARFFIHSASYGTGFAKQGDIEAHVEYSKGMLRDIMTKAYKGFLTDSEIELLFIGKDYYFTLDESSKRLEKRAAYLKDKYEKEQASGQLADEQSLVDNLEVISSEPPILEPDDLAVLKPKRKR